MEPSKRKRSSDDPLSFPRRRPPPPSSRNLRPSQTPIVILDDDDRTVTDEEVEEFFAIIRRVHEASLSLSGRPKAQPAAVAKWSPAFAWEDFSSQCDPVNDDVEGRRNAEGEGDDSLGDEEGRPEAPSPAAAGEENVTGRFLDLNAIPEESEGYSSSYSEKSPGGKSTDPHLLNKQ